MERQTHTLEIPGATVRINERRYQRGSEYNASPRMYVDINDTLFENLLNRTRRPYNVYKTLIHETDLHKYIDLGKLQWSQHAGCSCPCSPGFILPHQHLTFEGKTFVKFDLWLELVDAPAVNPAKAPRVLV